jgi:hypothetical protein
MRIGERVGGLAERRKPSRSRNLLGKVVRDGPCRLAADDSGLLIRRGNAIVGSNPTGGTDPVGFRTFACAGGCSPGLGILKTGRMSSRALAWMPCTRVVSRSFCAAVSPVAMVLRMRRRSASRSAGVGPVWVMSSSALRSARRSRSPAAFSASTCTRCEQVLSGMVPASNARR